MLPRTYETLLEHLGRKIQSEMYLTGRCISRYRDGPETYHFYTPHCPLEWCLKIMSCNLSQCLRKSNTLFFLIRQCLKFLLSDEAFCYARQCGCYDHLHRIIQNAKQMPFPIRSMQTQFGHLRSYYWYFRL